MTRLAGRIGLIGLGVLLALAILCSVYVWHLGSDLIARGKSAGWDVTGNAGELSVLEQTAAKALFADSWNQSGFPCRTIANGLTGSRAAMPVSAFVARDMLMEVDRKRTLEASVTRVSAACQLELAHSDTALLRLWFSHFNLAGHDGVEAAAQNLFGKPSAQLDENESARLVALLNTPNVWKRPEHWAGHADHVLARARQYVWAGDKLAIKDAKP
jgi:hypothetical protein